MSEIKPALTAEEWAMARVHVSLYPTGKDLMLQLGNRHGIAAAALHDQPFGFTREDVVDEHQAYHDAVMLARHFQDSGMERERLACKERARRHKERADRIEALLPPEEK